MTEQTKKPYLPRWAKEEIEDLTREVERLRAENVQLRGFMSGDGTSLFKIRRGAMSDDLPLPGFAYSVQVMLPNGFEMTITPQQDGAGGVGSKDTVELMVTSHHGISVEPQSGNVVHVGPRADRRR